MKRNLCFLLLAVFVYSTHAQEYIQETGKIKTSTSGKFFSSIKKKKRKQVAPAIRRTTLDSAFNQNGDIIQSSTERPLEINTNLKENLTDNPEGARMDSLWRNELIASRLYSKIGKDFSEQHYIPEVLDRNISTALLKSRLNELDSKTPFNVAHNKTLESVINMFLNRHKKTYEELMTVSQYYFPLFEEELDKYDIPLEMKYLAIVESALDPKAKSRSGATGLWQFMYGTGKMMDLEVNSYVDRRRDPIEATKAACEYLSKLYNTFGDWELAIAAYNSGPGNVTKAIRRSGGKKNFWEIRKYLPRETAGYVPSFLATLYIFEYADEHGFQPLQSPTPYVNTDTISVKSTLTFDQVSKATNMPVSEIEFYNPTFKLGIIPKVEGEQYALRLPKKELGIFVANEEAIYRYAEQQNRNNIAQLPHLYENGDLVNHHVIRGETLGAIAMAYGVKISSLKRWNKLTTDKLEVGQRIMVYPKNAVSGIAQAKEEARNSANTKIYVVKQGDTLWKISKRFPGVTVQNIKKWNGISGNLIKTGMKLKVSKG
ncbi:hypothetical protein GCM10009117_18930 [Gangjinia marincola]|uniref:LysM domain-containing protein n=1 Tax=Gangjinia marincola TaxID=578463 RepID=A0ABN1MHT1_9FLAO